MADGLTGKQRRFVEEYLVDLNATQAAIRAGYSPKTAYSIGAENLSKPLIAAAIEAGKRMAREKNAITASRVIEELGYIALSDPAKLYDKGGRMLSIHEMPEEARRAIATIEVDDNGEIKDGKPAASRTRKVRLYDKPRALQLLGQHFGILKDQVELTGKNGGAIEIDDPSGLAAARRVAFLFARATRNPKAGAA